MPGFDSAKTGGPDQRAVAPSADNASCTGTSNDFLCCSDIDKFKFKAGELRVALGLQTVSDIDQRSFVECYFSAAGWPCEAAAPADCAEAERFSGSCELKADVFLFDETDRRCERQAASDKDRLAVADSERFTLFELIEEVLRQVTQEDHGVAFQGRSQNCFRQPGRSVELHSFAQEVHSV